MIRQAQWAHNRYGPLCRTNNMRFVENHIKVLFEFIPENYLVYWTWILWFEGSENERQDIRAAYLSSRGAINGIMANIPFAWPDDRARISLIVDGEYLNHSSSYSRSISHLFGFRIIGEGVSPKVWKKRENTKSWWWWASNGCQESKIRLGNWNTKLTNSKMMYITFKIKSIPIQLLFYLRYVGLSSTKQTFEWNDTLFVRQCDTNTHIEVVLILHLFCRHVLFIWFL